MRQAPARRDKTQNKREYHGGYRELGDGGGPHIPLAERHIEPGPAGRRPSGRRPLRPPKSRATFSVLKSDRPKSISAPIVAGARIRLRALCLGLSVALLSPTAGAKDPTQTVVILYEGASGPAFVIADGLRINTKTELYACVGNERFDNNGYKRLPKVPLAQMTALERGSDGVIRMTSASGVTCVVPQNLKLEKRTGLTPKDLADMATLSGRFLAKSASTMGSDMVPPEFKTGMKIVVVPAPDPELAEYLRVTREPSISLLREYLQQYPAAAHTPAVKNSLAGMIAEEGENALLAFRRSVETGAPDYGRLRAARERAGEALQVVVAFVRAEKLRFETDSLTQNLLGSGCAGCAAESPPTASRNPARRTRCDNPLAAAPRSPARATAAPGSRPSAAPRPPPTASSAAPGSAPGSPPKALLQVLDKSLKTRCGKVVLHRV
jgi:hypothetical protein